MQKFHNPKKSGEFATYLTVLLLVFAGMVSTLSVDNAWAGNDQIAPYMSGRYPRTLSQYTVLMDAATGKILYSQNAYAHREPASTTKMVAAIVLLENGRLSDTVTAPQAVAKTPESSLHLSPGERISLEDLLYAMMLRSANDTPIAGAYYLCGGVPPFVALMNEKAASIGCSNTHFVTPNGLYDPNHYSCAADLASIARYGLTNLPMFREIVKTQRRRIHRSVHTDDTLVINTSSSFLQYFPGADGVKTGYISQAGHCFVGSATRGGWQLIAVALDSTKCRSDVVQMLSYGFAHFSRTLVAPAGTSEGIVSIGSRHVRVRLASPLWNVASRGGPSARADQYTTKISLLSISPSQPILLNEKLGSIGLRLNGKPIARVDLLSADFVAAEPVSLLSVAGNRSPGRVVRAILSALAVVLLLFWTGKKIVSFKHARKTSKNSRFRGRRIAKDV